MWAQIRYLGSKVSHALWGGLTSSPQLLKGKSHPAKSLRRFLEISSSSLSHHKTMTTLSPISQEDSRDFPWHLPTHYSRKPFLKLQDPDKASSLIVPSFLWPWALTLLGQLNHYYTQLAYKSHGLRNQKLAEPQGDSVSPMAKLH